MQVNIPAESGEMGVLANHVPSIEQLKPGLVEIIEESSGSKQYFRMAPRCFLLIIPQQIAAIYKMHAPEDLIGFVQLIRMF